MDARREFRARERLLSARERELSKAYREDVERLTGQIVAMKVDPPQATFYSAPDPTGNTYHSPVGEQAFHERDD